MKWLEGKWDDPFIAHVFTPAERDAALASSDPLVSFTLRFSAKESVFKAMRMDSDSARLDQIEILEDSLGRPSATLLGSMDARMRARGDYTIHVSLSYEDEYASTFAVIELL